MDALFKKVKPCLLKVVRDSSTHGSNPSLNFAALLYKSQSTLNLILKPDSLEGSACLLVEEYSQRWNVSKLNSMTSCSTINKIEFRQFPYIFMSSNMPTFYQMTSQSWPYLRTESMKVHHSFEVSIFLSQTIIFSLMIKDVHI